MTVALIAVLWGGLTVYAVLGGADFGAGVLHLLAPERRRAAILAAMGPVWEANHVWLIFFLTGLLTAFPGAYSALGAALFAPATVALFGLTVRGAALAFKQTPAFGVASAVTPLVFGMTAAGLADDGSWIGVFPLAVGLLAVALCTALAASRLRWRTQALRAALVALVLAPAALSLAPWIIGRAWPAVALGGVAFAVAPLALRRESYRIARAALAVAMAALLWGWGISQYPRITGGVTLSQAVAPPAELHAVAIALAVAAVLVLPSLALLFRAFRRDRSEVPR